MKTGSLVRCCSDIPIVFRNIISIVFCSFIVLFLCSCSKNEAVESVEVITGGDDVRYVHPIDNDNPTQAVETEVLDSGFEISIDDLIVDLENSNSFLSYSDPLSISDLSILRRRDGDDTEEIWVNCTASNNTVECELAYYMQYGLYNNGWWLDSVEAYDASEWIIYPIDFPSEDDARRDITYQGYNLCYTDCVNGFSDVSNLYTLYFTDSYYDAEQVILITKSISVEYSFSSVSGEWEYMHTNILETNYDWSNLNNTVWQFNFRDAIYNLTFSLLDSNNHFNYEVISSDSNSVVRVGDVYLTDEFQGPSYYYYENEAMFFERSDLGYRLGCIIVLFYDESINSINFIVDLGNFLYRNSDDYVTFRNDYTHDEITVSRIQ